MDRFLIRMEEKRDILVKATVIWSGGGWSWNSDNRQYLLTLRFHLNNVGGILLPRMLRGPHSGFYPFSRDL